MNCCGARCSDRSPAPVETGAPPATHERGLEQGGLVDDRYARLESTVEGLRRIVESLEQRVAVLEAVRPAGASAVGGATAGTDNASEGSQALDRVRARRD